jgi:chromatin remodeling complex protein RSC6
MPAKKTTTTTPAADIKETASTPAKTAPKKVVKKAAAPPKAATPVVAAKAAPVVEAAGGGVDTEEADKPEESDLMEVSAVFFTKLQQMGTMITAVKSEYRALEKKWVREIKQAQKAAKRKRKVGNRAPSGFVKAARISDELAAFLGVDKGVEMARTDVTKEITAYVKKHELQDPANGRDINPDAKLKKLLHIGADDKLSYFNLQKFMSPHFHKKSDDAVPAVAAV